MCVNNLPNVVTWKSEDGSRTLNLCSFINALTLHHQAILELSKYVFYICAQLDVTYLLRLRLYGSENHGAVISNESSVINITVLANNYPFGFFSFPRANYSVTAGLIYSPILIAVFGQIAESMCYNCREKYKVVATWFMMTHGLSYLLTCIVCCNLQLMQKTFV